LKILERIALAMQ